MHFISARIGRRRASFFVWLALAFLLWVGFSLIRAVHSQRHPRWTQPIIGDPPTLVFGREDLRRIWNWEIASGHYPSKRPIPEQIRITSNPLNPGLPVSPRLPRNGLLPLGDTIGTGSDREYLDIQAKPPNTAYPPRVPTGSVADLDIIMDNCDFSQQKTVRDCLEVMRLGAGLDVGRRLRRGKVDVWRYIFKEAPSSSRKHVPPATQPLSLKQQKLLRKEPADPDAGLWKRDVLEAPLTSLSEPVPTIPFADLPKESPCDPDYPRIFHMFWAGPFNEKPYVAMLSYLFTQNLGLHLEKPDPTVCRPQFWMWINPGPAAAVPNPNALRDMFQSLADNPWAAPFLHPRFKDVIKFKMWNTTEQLDGVPELKDEWRKFPSLFNSGGVKYEAKKAPPPQPPNLSSQPEGTNMTGASPPPKKDGDDLFDRLGSTSSSTYDRLSVVLSDMARFVLTHRFGGTYLDADSIFLRDWEELWGWRGAFAYRWSRLPTYNTAVLRLNKGSALGTFLFKTALRNDLDFHPMTVGRYTKDSYLESLLLRLPDAMFDPAWLAQEGYQKERPPYPMFQDFKHFFTPPSQEAAAPQSLGFDGFFKGAYSYHFHNFWWVPFDPARNFPDLGPKFKEGERKARAKLRSMAEAEKRKEDGADGASGKRYTPAPRVPTAEEVEQMEAEEDNVFNDSRDLAWSAVLKRTFEAYIRGERPNMYGEWLRW
ncbi:hypothetical protein FRC02_001636 [Tulasnella sp. 418]|nr:hypothetical protein FRC02_001636 [Tulasnella sp. 418]